MCTFRTSFAKCTSLCQCTFALYIVYLRSYIQINVCAEDFSFSLSLKMRWWSPSQPKINGKVVYGKPMTRISSGLRASPTWMVRRGSVRPCMCGCAGVCVRAARGAATHTYIVRITPSPLISLALSLSLSLALTFVAFTRRLGYTCGCGWRWWLVGLVAKSPLLYTLI